MKHQRKLVLVFLATLVLSIFIAVVKIEPVKAAVALDATTIPKYTDALVANIPVYLPTNVTAGGNVVRQDYYVNVSQFTETILPASMGLTTTVWGYGGLCYDALNDPNALSPFYFRNSPSATFLVNRGIPTKVTWVNNLTTVDGTTLLNYLYPVDPTFDWANPNGYNVDTALTLAGLGLAPPYPPGYNGSAIISGGVATNPLQWNANSPVPIVTHVHGAEVYSGSDGGPNQWFTPNGIHGMDYYTYEPTYPNAAVYYYNNTQQESTLWYHDHAMGLTRINVFSGLAGYYIIKDPANAVGALLPSGAYDVPLAIQDRAFYNDGSLRFDIDPPPNPTVHPYWVPEYFGDTFMVNGKVWPYFNVNQSTYRFRLLDGCNARFLNLSIVDLTAGNTTVPFTVIARDQGYLNTSITGSNILIGPGMRAEILVNFTGIPTGHQLLLMNSANAPFPGGNPVLTGLTDEIMKFIVQGTDATPQYNLPTALNPTISGATWPTTPTPTKIRQLTLKEVMGPGGPVAVLIEGQHFMSEATEKPIVGTTEEWKIVNPTADAHPMHWHLVSFQLVSRQPFDDVGYVNNWTALNGGETPMAGYSHNTLNPANLTAFYTGPARGPEPDEFGWLDTVTMYPGEVTTVRISYKTQEGGAYPFDAAAGSGYVWHCHIVDHEDNDMMRKQLPMLASQQTPYYDVVRGFNDLIYYRTYSFATSSWGPYTIVPGGSTVDTPTAAQVNGMLYIAVRGSDGISIWFGSLNLTSTTFSGWTQVPGSTLSAPKLVAYGTTLYLVVRSQSNDLYYRTYDTVAGTWTGWQVISDGATSDTPAAAVIGDYLYVVVRGYSSTNALANDTLYFGFVNLRDNNFSGWTAASGTTPSTPVLVAETPLNAVTLIVRGSNDLIYTNRFDGTSWSGFASLPAGSTTYGPAAVYQESNNTIYFEVVASTGVVYVASQNTVSGAFSGWTAQPGSTPSNPAMTK